jgi:glycosyltransferase involved in cell wall biosynthesis
MAEVSFLPVTVVVTTFCSPGTLRLVLLALARQSHAPIEVLVADDGSGDETREALTRVAAGVPYPLTHVWQPHDGFRLARSRNNAIHRARGEAVAFLDQDTLPHRDWLAIYAGRIRAGRVCLGHVLDLPAETAGRLNDESVQAGEYETWHTQEAQKALLRIHRKACLYAALRAVGFRVKNRPRVRGSNFCATTADLRRVNGFDEAYVGWGQEDDDLGRRLYAAGVRPLPLVSRARVSHIPHEERRRGSWREGPNVARYERADAPIRCARGLDLHPHAEVRVTQVRA